IAFWKSMTSAFVTSTSPYTWDWNAPESVMTAPGNPRNAWMPSRTIESRAGDFPMMYAFVIKICAPNRVAKSPGGMIGRFGLTTGARVGVATRPCPVSSTPIRARPSRSRISNMRGHRSPVNKSFPRRRAPPRKGYLSRAGCAISDAPRDVRSHPGRGLPDGGTTLAAGNPNVGRFLTRVEAAPCAHARRESHRRRDRPVRRGVAPGAASVLRAEPTGPGPLARLARVLESNRVSGHRDDRLVTRSSAVTVVGVYDGSRRRSFIQGANLEDLPAAMERAKLLVTFNGSRFDVPVLLKAFPRMALDQIHLDLVHPLRRLGFVGGLKAIESQEGILRSEETTGVGSCDAVRLWHAYDAGDDDALDLLLEYNMEDVVNLEPLAELAYEGLRSLCLGGGFVTADRLPQRSMPPARDPQKNRN